MTAEQLKASVLQMAIEGRLVPQLEEEPAVSLDVEEPDDVPFAIPEKWKWVRLRELVIPCSQKVPDKKFNYIDVASIDNKKHKLGEVKITFPENAPSRARKIVKNGMVIYSTVRPYLLNTCIIDGDFSDEIICSTAFVAVECKDILLNEYLLNVLISPYFCEYVKDIQRGVAYPAITDKGFYSASFPLPPLEEQRRIVARLDEILPLIESYGKAHDALEAAEKALPDKLRASLLQEAISGRLVPQLDEEPAVSLDVEEPDDVPFAIPEKWKWVRLKDVGDIVSGATPKTGVAEYWSENEISWITPADLGKNRGKTISHGARFLSQKGLDSCSAVLMPANSIVYSSRAPIGHIAIAENSLATNQGCKSVVPDTEKVCPEYVYYTLIALTPEIVSRASGTTFLEISGKKMGETLFPLPPLEEQRRIVARLNELLPCVDAMAKLHDGEKR